MRVVGLDVGTRRVGVAVSDASGTLARPAGVIRIQGLGQGAIDQVADAIARLMAEQDGVAAIVVGLPRHLDGSPSGMTGPVEAFARTLATRTGLPVALQDERLTSREAESRLALREKDWRVRKARLDAAAAAIVLQDYLDAVVQPRSLDVEP